MGDSEKCTILLEKVHCARFGLNNLLKAVVDLQHATNPTRKARVLQEIADSAKNVQENIHYLKLFELPPPNVIVNGNERWGVSGNTKWQPLADRSDQLYTYMDNYSIPFFPSVAKRRKVSPPEQAMNIDIVLEHVASQNSAITFHKVRHPYLQGCATTISFVYKDLFQGELLFANPLSQLVERVTFCGLNEKGQSKHCIFLAITEQARAAIAYYSAYYPGTELQKICKWISSFENVFSSECIGCGKMLHLDAAHSTNRPIFLPPSFRTYESLLPYHPQCVVDYSA